MLVLETMLIWQGKQFASGTTAHALTAASEVLLLLLSPITSASINARGLL